MKKNLSFLLVLLMLPAFCFAQLLVNSQGTVSVQTPSLQAETMFAVGPFVGDYNDYKFAMVTRRNPVSYYRTVGLYSRVLTADYLGSGRAFGLFGTAGNATSGYNYGVAGSLSGLYNGAAIYGTSDDFISIAPGMYAGYFRGDTYVEGNLTATNVITPSDIRLKTNINNLSESGSALDNLSRINVLSYNYKKREIPMEERDTMQAATLRLYDKKWDKDAKERHFGISAQELQEVYPELVKEGQDGFLGVNYVELVPVLIQSIQELKAELDAVKGSPQAKTRSVSDESADINTAASGNVLYQNTPNPFKEQTIIHFRLADNVQNACICFFDMTGKQLKKLPISSEMENVSIGSYELGEGMFLYSLIVNGQEIDTKKMVITK